jgi:hypothetical protein
VPSIPEAPGKAVEKVADKVEALKGGGKEKKELGRFKQRLAQGADRDQGNRQGFRGKNCEESALCE